MLKKNQNRNRVLLLAVGLGVLLFAGESRSVWGQQAPQPQARSAQPTANPATRQANPTGSANQASPLAANPPFASKTPVADAVSAPLGTSGDSANNPNSLDSIPEVRQGLEFLKKGDRAQAAAQFATAYQKRPDLVPAGIAIATAFFNEQKFDQVRFWLEQTVEDCPNDPEAYVILAEVAQSEGRTLEARMLAQEGLVLASRYANNPERQKKLALRGQLVLVLVAEGKQRWAEAQERLERMVQGAPDEPEYWIRLGVVFFQQNDMQKALNAFNQASSKGTTVPHPYAIVAQLYDQKGNTKEAERYLNEALKLNQNDFQIMSIAAQLATKWDHVSEARQYAERALKLKPDSYEAKAMCGLLALYERNYPIAQGYYEAMVKEKPDDFAGKNGLALALCEQQDATKTARALTLAKENAQANPASIDALTTLAWANYKSGQTAQAEQILLQIHQSGVMSAVGAYYLAEILNAKGESEQAAALTNAALSTNMNFPKKSDATLLQKQLTR